ncbi:LytS/YhcK type 5TM receptor domain-containing protein [Shewanella fodinae]|uniref:LytS/YhcK type 5TM receptor domain-containing protein n=1 Tax=Shewanella fodinae TaxID=552357 RepID=UPI001985A64F|nr:LytS/YhcK type 5TM receptor domain-containing protein [Shewanella fodinae]GGZ11008.1 sensor histidine kinase [Shewanella fodinae]
MYSEQLMMLLAVLERAALMLMALFLLTRSQRFQQIFQKKDRHPWELILVSLLFVCFAVFSTYTGIHVEGSLVNVRIIAIMSGGLLFGPAVGIPAGIISGIHRYLIDIDGPTSIPCLISSITAGLLSTWMYFRCKREQLWLWGIIGGMLCEGLTMLLIVTLAPQPQVGWNIVSVIAFPMICGTICIGLIVQLVQNLDDEKERIAGQHAKLALDIANRTLPYFRENNRSGLRQVCSIIREHISADAVAMTNTDDVLAYVGHAEADYWQHYHGMSSVTRKALDSGKVIINNGIDYADFHSLMIVPLTENNQVTGTLKIYYCHEGRITDSLKEMAIGLSHVISTQIEAARSDQLKQMAAKAEFSALQNKINPHFLFNSLNAISSLIRLRPEEARQLISNLADFLRYNLKRNEELIDIQEELEQVRDYVAIEKARFGKKLTVTFDVDDVHQKVPGLLLQPLVENAILHGIQPVRGNGEVTIAVKQHTDQLLVTVRDTGKGIDEAIIEGLYHGKVPSDHIGLMNVHERVKLLYGHGLTIRRCEPGTEVSFSIAQRK